MTNGISGEDFSGALLGMLEEVFEQVHGYILDRGTSMFETLADVTAEEASRHISERCAPIAAQVNHVRFYLETLNEVARTGEFKRVDWPSSWQVGPVTESEWESLLAGLRTAYEETKTFARTFTNGNQNMIGGALAIVSHSAYHLGEIRQGLGVLRSQPAEL